MIELVSEWFDVHPQRSFQVDGYTAFYDGQFIYIMVRVYEKEQDELLERFEMADFLRNVGEKYVPIFLAAKDGKYVVEWGNDYYILLKLDQWRNQPYQFLGRQLANFHYRGFSLQTNIQVLNRVGKWKQLWEHRIGHLEKFWQSTVMSKPQNEFEKRFIESYPYFSGLTENAIQYLVDTTFDESPGNIDQPTICHDHFQKDTWNGSLLWKNPFTWVLDHPSRDVAEWTRNTYYSKKQTYQNQLQSFYQSYQSRLPLSSFSWRFIYARLLLPIDYFQCIEGYYAHLGSATVDRGRLANLQQIMEHSEAYETFLTYFYEVVEVPTRTRQIPRLDWLKK